MMENLGIDGKKRILKKILKEIGFGRRSVG
jgi:hypothetical protein